MYLRKLWQTQRGNQILAAVFWAVVLGGWGLLHAVQFSPLGAFGLADGCIIKQATGFSCWSCGLTRMLDSFIRLDVAAAFLYNPYFFVITALLLCYAVCFTLNALHKGYTGPLFPRPRIWYAVVFLVTLLLFTVLRNTPFYLSFFYV